MWGRKVCKGSEKVYKGERKSCWVCALERNLACGWRAEKGACLALSTRGHLAPGNEAEAVLGNGVLVSPTFRGRVWIPQLRTLKFQQLETSKMGLD